jgi:hypothetical protein
MFLLNPILARKDFPSKGLARYKKCQGRRNNYIGNAVLGRHTGVAPLRKAAPNPEFVQLGNEGEFGNERAIH